MWRSVRLALWFFKAFLKKYLKIISLGLILGTAFFVFYYRFGHFLPSPKKTNRIGLVGRYTAAELPLTVLEKISRGLTKINPDGSVSGDLAESWKIKDGGKIYLFQLKKGLFWQDGRPLKASEINLEFKNVTLEAKSDLTLEFKLEDSFSPFPTILARPVFKKALLGTGPYKIKSIKSSGNFIQSIKLENKDSLVFKFYPTEKAAILGFKLGEIDALRDINDPSPFENWPKANLAAKILQDQFVALFYNAKDPQLDNKTLRQALTYAIKKPEDKSRALGSLHPHSWAYNSQVKPYNYDPKKAKELLEETKLEKVNIELSTTFSQLSTAEEIKKSWQEIGVETNIKVVSTLPESFQAFLASQKIPDDPDQYTLWHSTQNTNITGYNNAKVDKLLEDGRKIIEKEERKAIYLDFQRFLVEDAAAAFLFHPTAYTISRRS